MDRENAVSRIQARKDAPYVVGVGLGGFYLPLGRSGDFAGNGGQLGLFTSNNTANHSGQGH